MEEESPMPMFMGIRNSGSLQTHTMLQNLNQQTYLRSDNSDLKLHS